MVPSGMSRPIEKSGSVVEETEAVPMKDARSAPMSLEPPSRSQSLRRRQASFPVRTSALGWSPASISQLTSSG